MTISQYDAIGIAEGFVEYDSEEQYLEAWQYLIDTGLAWSLQGFFGRTARDLIDDGLCLPAENSKLLKAAKQLNKIEFITVK